MTPPTRGPIRLLTVCGSLQAHSANRAALDVVQAAARRSGGAVESFDGLERIPPLNPDRVDDAGVAVAAWRAAIAAADVVVIASPEYAGAVAGVMKNALDWIVGSGEFYDQPVGLISAGTSGGLHARRDLVRTLAWQGAFVVASLGIDAPRTKSDADGGFTDPATIAELERFTDLTLRAGQLGRNDRHELMIEIATEAGVDPARIVRPQ